MSENKKIPVNQNNKKNEANNQWVSTGLDHYPDLRERKDGPGGEDAEK